MAIVDDPITAPVSWFHDNVGSEGAGPQIAATTAPIDPPEYPDGENAAPIKRVGGVPPAQLFVKGCKMMSRCPQQSGPVRMTQAMFDVGALNPPHPSEYIQ
jgi:hypothetical protein